MSVKKPASKKTGVASDALETGAKAGDQTLSEPAEAPRRLPFPFSVFSALYTKWFGPPPAAVGPVLPDHSEVDMSTDEPGMLKSQLIFILIVSFFGIALYWANTAELDKQVRADGSIVPPSDVQIVQARLPGLITQISVELGSKVEKDDILFRMEDKDVQAEYDNNEILLTTSQIAVIRLQAETDGLDTVTFPSHLITAAPSEVQAEQALFAQRRRALLSEIDVLRQEVESLNRNINERQAAARIARDQAAIFKEEYNMIKPLVDDGHEPRIKLIEAEKRLQESQGAAELAVLSIQAMNSDLATKQKQIISVRQNYQAEAGAQLIEAQTRLSQARARQDALAGRVGYAEVRAPHTGTVSALHLKTVGAVVQPGTLLAEIVPEEKAVTIRANLKPENVADVYVGQIARISLSAYDVSRYGSLEGVVKHIASNTTEREGQPPFYETIITVPDPVFPKIDLTPDIVPGMTVVVDIIGGKRTVLDYILSPIDRATRVAFREN